MLTDFRIVIPGRPPGPAFGRPDGRLREVEASIHNPRQWLWIPGSRPSAFGPTVSPGNDNTYYSNFKIAVLVRNSASAVKPSRFGKQNVRRHT
jgi:hypothetical protein